MNEKLMELAGLLEDVTGPDHVTLEPDISIDGLTPSLLVRPASAGQVAQCLNVCAKLNCAVVPAGFMTWLEGGNPLRRAVEGTEEKGIFMPSTVVLSLERMNRIIDYSPPDLTVTVEAGLSLDALNSETRRERQWLPLDPTGASRASMGAIAACDASGALRSGFGTPRDYVIGLRLAHADGTESKSGGRVVKNVAGYDMNKLYVGSFGTLAVLTELTFKLRPLPESFETLIVTSKNSRSLFECARRLLSSPLQPASVLIAQNAPDIMQGSRGAGEQGSNRRGEGIPTTDRRPPTAEELSAVYGGNRALFIRFIESEAAVRYQSHQVAQMLDEERCVTSLSESEAEAVWSQLGDIDLRAANAVRLSVPMSATADVFDKVLSFLPECIATADLGAGTIRLAFEADAETAIKLIKRLRGDAVQAGGTLFIERAQTTVRREADAWGEVGPAERLMKAVKAHFDPQSLLNPGRFVSGI